MLINTYAKNTILLLVIFITFSLSTCQVSAAEENMYARDIYREPVYFYVLKKSKTFIEQGRYEKTLRILSPFINEPLQYPDAVADYIATLVWIGNYSKAIYLFEELPRNFPTYPYLLRNMAKAYYETNNYNKALKLYRSVLDRNSDDIEAKKGILLSLDQTGNNKALLFYLDKLRSRDAGNVSLELTRSTLFMKNGHYRNAFNLLHDVERKGWLNEDSLIKFYRDLYASLPESSYTSIQNWLINEAGRGNLLALSDLVMMLAVKGDYAEIVRNVQSLNGHSDLIQNHSARWIAWAYFKTGNIDRAKSYYLRLLKKTPFDIRTKTGLAYCYAAEENIDKSLAILDDLAGNYPDDINISFARAYAFENANDFWSAIKEYDHILTIDSKNGVAEKHRLIALSELGLSSYAREKTDQRFPDDVALQRRLEGNSAVDFLRWKEYEHSLSILREQRKEEENPRARYDYIVALTSNLEMEKAVKFYEELDSDGIKPPAWIIEHIAGAYLYLEQPHKALSLYNDVLEKDPKSYNSRLGKFYVLQELRQWNDARKILNDLDNEVPLYLKPGRKVRPNWPKADIALAKGWFFAYEEKLREADDYFQGINFRAPANTNFRTGLAYTHLWRGWPGKALGEFDISIQLDPRDINAHTGRIISMNMIADKERARAESQALLEKYPNNKHVKALDERLKLEEMRELNSRFSFSTDEDGVEGYSAEIRLIQPLALYTDLYVYGLWQRTSDDNQESTYRRTGVGIDHFFNSTFRLLQQLSINYDDGRDFGSLTQFNITPDDYWLIMLAYDSFSTDVPLRARVFDIDADELKVSLIYRESEWRKYKFAYTHMEFSDGNERDHGLLGYEQGLYVGNDWKMKLFFDLYASVNSKDNTPYFNPENDLSYSATHMTEHTLLRLYRKAFIHRLFLTVGGYSQSGHSDAVTGSVRYEHDINFSNKNSLFYGAGLSSSSYDENSVIGYNLDLNWRLLF